MEFNKQKFSHFVMERPYLGEVKETPEGQAIYKHALDKAGCGDSYEISVLIDQNKNVVDAKYITYGCGYAQATCCALIESIIGQNVADIASWSDKEVEGKIESIMGEYPVHKKAYMFFAKELLDGVCHKALGQDHLVSDVAKN
jgi:NifU-like protein involved in Fe-S cluster formation